MDFSLALDTFPVVDLVDIEMPDAFLYQHDEDSFLFDHHDHHHDHHHDSLHHHDDADIVSDVTDGKGSSSWDSALKTVTYSG
jgi:hypothetical protein